jgi:hypothetical protein
MDDVLDFLKFLFPVFILLAIIVVAVVGLATISEKKYCDTMESINDNFEFRWGFWTGCLVQTPSGYWINAHEYNYLEGDVR